MSAMNPRAAKPRYILFDDRIRYDSCDERKNISGLRRSDGVDIIPYPALKRRATDIPPPRGGVEPDGGNVMPGGGLITTKQMILTK
jgi:hypothetical protein